MSFEVGRTGISHNFCQYAQPGTPTILPWTQRILWDLGDCLMTGDKYHPPYVTTQFQSMLIEYENWKLDKSQVVYGKK